jgi:uncharacterized protein (DUF885 family)
MDTPTPIFELADRYVTGAAALDPVWATEVGVVGVDDRMTDFSPDGTEARAEHARQTLVELASAARNGPHDELAAAFLTERLDMELAMIDAHEPLCDLNNIASPMQGIRSCFDLMAYDSADDWETARHRLEAVPAAIAGLRATYEEGRRLGLVAARRQAVEAAHQAALWAGDESDPPFFATLVEGAAGVPGMGPAELGRLRQAAEQASSAYHELSGYLREVYAPDATEADGVGADRYALRARAFLGAEIDLIEAYEWGWEELGRLEQDMVEQCASIRPGATLSETVAWLEDGSDLVIEGEDALRDWLQQLMDQAVRDLEGTHFDIDPSIRTVEAMIAPPGGAAAMYYTSPAEDLSRPGRTWYPANGQTRFPLWTEVSTAYHEGVPGHHLQGAQIILCKDQLSRFQRISFISGHGEGWALYAERLMDELGYLDRPEYRLGYLAAQAMRAVRVVVDIGVHLGLEIPPQQPGPEPTFRPGARWDAGLVHEFVLARSRLSQEFAESEVLRYLGWPGQAISYKVGERVWLEAREQAQARHGADFDLKAFHAYALDLGPIGLDLLRDRLAAF